MAEEAGKNPQDEYTFRWGAKTHIGHVRQENEDAYLVDPDLGLFLVSDGMGGHQGGSAASKIVANSLPAIISRRLEKLKSASTRTVRAALKKSIPELNQHLRAEGATENRFKNMGATLVILLFKNNRAFIANIGDSRAYIFRRNRLRQLTKDHTVVSELLEQGRIDIDESENHPSQGHITQCLGIDDEAQPFIRTLSLRSGDRFLLCTDGLTDVVSDKAIRKILKNNEDPQQSCRELIKTANNASGHDNTTTIIIDWLNNS